MTLKAQVEWLQNPKKEYQQVLVLYGTMKDLDSFREQLRNIGLEYFLFEYKDKEQYSYAFTSALCDFFIVLEEEKK